MAIGEALREVLNEIYLGKHFRFDFELESMDLLVRRNKQIQYPFQTTLDYQSFAVGWKLGSGSLGAEYFGEIEHKEDGISVSGAFYVSYQTLILYILWYILLIVMFTVWGDSVTTPYTVLIIPVSILYHLYGRWRAIKGIKRMKSAIRSAISHT